MAKIPKIGDEILEKARIFRQATKPAEAVASTIVSPILPSKAELEALSAQIKGASKPPVQAPTRRRSPAVATSSPLASVRGTTPAVMAQNEAVEKALPKETVDRIANALRLQNEANQSGIVVPMTDYGLSPIDILAFQNARSLAGASPSVRNTFASYLDMLSKSQINARSDMPLGNAEDLRKAIGMEAGLGVTDTTAPLRYIDSSGNVISVPTGVGYNALFDGWGNAKSARPRSPVSSVILQGSEKRPIELAVRDDEMYIPTRLNFLQPENQIDVALGKIDTRGTDFPTFASDIHLDLARQSLNKRNAKQVADALVEASYGKNWDKQERIAQQIAEGRRPDADKGIPPEDLKVFRRELKARGLDALPELFALNRKFRKLYADTMSGENTTRGLGIPHYTSYTNALLADPIKRTQFGGTTQLLLKPLDEGKLASDISPDYRFEYEWHTPTETLGNLYGENIPRSLMYQTGIKKGLALNPSLKGSEAQNQLLIRGDAVDRRTLLQSDVEDAIQFSKLWKKATSGQGLTKEEADELMRLDALRRYQY